MLSQVRFGPLTGRRTTALTLLSGLRPRPTSRCIAAKIARVARVLVRFGAGAGSSVLHVACKLNEFPAQTRIVSVTRIRLDSWKFVRPFKGLFCDDISEIAVDTVIAVNGFFD
jgi:hypothetical protein